MKKVVKTKKEKEDSSGLFIPAGACIGLGFGFLFNQVPGGLLIGLGLGFVALAVVKIFTNK